MIETHFESKITWVAPREPFEDILWSRHKRVDIPLAEGLATTSFEGCIVLAYASVGENVQWGPGRIIRVSYLRCDGPTVEGIGDSPTNEKGECIDGDDIIGSPRMSIQNPWGPDLIRHGPSTFGRRLRKCDGEEHGLHPNTRMAVEAWDRTYREFYGSRAAIRSGKCHVPADDDWDAMYRSVIASEIDIVWHVDPKLVSRANHVWETLGRPCTRTNTGLLVLGHTTTDRGGVCRLFGLRHGETGLEKSPLPMPGWKLVCPRSVRPGVPCKPADKHWLPPLPSTRKKLAALHEVTE